MSRGIFFICNIFLQRRTTSLNSLCFTSKRVKYQSRPFVENFNEKKVQNHHVQQQQQQHTQTLVHNNVTICYVFELMTTRLDPD